MMDSRCARAAYIHDYDNYGEKECLVWSKSVGIKEIAAHPPDFTEFLVFVSVECLKGRWVDINNSIVKIVFVFVWIRM